jgi:hypothetical protein
LNTEPVPRSPRIDVSIPAVVMNFGGSLFEVSIENFSASGLCFKTHHMVPIGRQIIVVSDVAGSIPAQVRWALGDRVGCYFNGKMSDDAARFIKALIPNTTSKVS